MRRYPLHQVSKACATLLGFEDLDLAETLVAVKIVHTVRWQQVWFGDRSTAEQYAVQHGGLDYWRVLTIPREDVGKHIWTKGRGARLH